MFGVSKGAVGLCRIRIADRQDVEDHTQSYVHHPSVIRIANPNIKPAILHPPHIKTTVGRRLIGNITISTILTRVIDQQLTQRLPNKGLHFMLSPSPFFGKHLSSLGNQESLSMDS